MSLMLPVCPIPEELGWILQSHFHNNRRSYTQISDEIFQSPFLRVMVPKIFAPYIKSNNIESMLNALGWNGFRDRLTAIYLYKFEYGQFPTKITDHGMTELKVFEDEYAQYGFEGNSRIFMLGVYLKFCQMKLKKDHLFTDQPLLKLNPIIKKILDEGTQKTIKGDWLILSLIILADLIDEDTLYITMKQNKGSFYKVMSLLEESHKEKFIANLLAYGASINDDEVFLYEKV